MQKNRMILEQLRHFAGYVSGCTDFIDLIVLRASSLAIACTEYVFRGPRPRLEFRVLDLSRGTACEEVLGRANMTITNA